jgi:hypothetical protein
MKSAIVGKNGTFWNAEATINCDDLEHVKKLAHVLLEQRNDMYTALTCVRQGYLNLIEFRFIPESHHKDLYKSISEIDALLAKTRGESNE